MCAGPVRLGSGVFDVDAQTGGHQGRATLQAIRLETSA